MADDTIAPDPRYTVTRAADLPRLRAALRHRYPYVAVELCESREYGDGRTGWTVSFRAPAEMLVRYGLAQQTPRRGDPDHLGGGDGHGTDFGGGRSGTAGELEISYVYHHCYDGEPAMPGSRTWPPKWVEKEVARIWRRISKSTRQS